MTFADAMQKYGNDKPDIRFGMEFVELNDLVKGKEFKIFDEAELVVGINVDSIRPGVFEYSRKQIDELIDWVKRPQIGATGMVWVKHQYDDSLTSSVNKFYNEEDLRKISERFGSNVGNLMFIMSGPANKVRAQLSALRMEIANRHGLRDGKVFAPLWVVDFHCLNLMKKADVTTQCTTLSPLKTGRYSFAGNGSGKSKSKRLRYGVERERNRRRFHQNI